MLVFYLKFDQKLRPVEISVFQKQIINDTFQIKCLNKKIK